jgi:hypothetical protein
MTTPSLTPILTPLALNNPASFINLTTLLQQSAVTTVATSLAAGAAIESIQVVDLQIAAINYVHIQGGFNGAAQMEQAVFQMQNAASAWPSVRDSIMVAAQRGMAAGPMAAGLGSHAASDAAQLAQQVQAFQTQVLSPLVAQFAAAQQQFNLFSQSMNQAYSQSARANQDAAAAVQLQQVQIQNEIDQLQARYNNLSSAGSILTGIFSLGISYALEMRQIQQEQQQLRNDEQQAAFNLRCYQNALGSFSNALNATKLASYALGTLDTSLQQASNKLSSISTMTSSNLAVMQAELAAFKAEFAQTVATIAQLIS